MKFCFFGNISGALQGKTLGGAELQIALLAKALALNGHKVVIIDPYSNESFVTAEGVKLINIHEWNKGIRGIRLFSHRIPALKKIFLEQNADYYYARMRTYFHLLSYRAAKKLNRKFILAIASDIDLLSIRKKIKYKYRSGSDLFRFITLHLPSDLAFNHLLKKADYITVQHSGQKINVKSQKGKTVLFPNIYSPDAMITVENSDKDYFVHVGDISITKGAENLHRLINILDKKIRITIVGTPIDNKSRRFYKYLQTLPNITLRGRLDHKETMKLIANSKALISTSNFEGFPNIFLEAWANGVPVISLKVNPGNVISEYKLGQYCNGSISKMKEYMELNITSDINKKALVDYVSTFHSFITAGDRFLNILEMA